MSLAEFLNQLLRHAAANDIANEAVVGMGQLEIEIFEISSAPSDHLVRLQHQAGHKSGGRQADPHETAFSRILRSAIEDKPQPAFTLNYVE